MSKADLVYFDYRSALGFGYSLGSEGPWVSIWGEPSSDPLKADCSGLMIAGWKRADVRFEGGMTYTNFFGTARPIADRMWDLSTKIDQPTKFGDCFFRTDSIYHAYHVGMYVGDGHTIEAGDGTGKIAMHTVTWQNNRRVKWGTFSTDIGERTPAGGTFPVPDWPVMKYGYYGHHVRALKNLLNQLIGAGLTTTWSTVGKSFGSQTKSKVQEFQREMGIDDNGIVDRDCLLAFMEALAPEGATPVPDPTPDPDPVPDPTPDPVPTGEVDASCMPTLYKGKRNSFVGAMKCQMQLHGFGMNLHPNNLSFGSLTDAAVREFQKSRGLNDDGRCGPDTWAALFTK